MISFEIIGYSRIIVGEKTHRFRIEIALDVWGVSLSSSARLHDHCIATVMLTRRNQRNTQNHALFMPRCR